MEKDLIIRLKRGDRRAFDAIYYKYVRQLTAYCLSYISSLEDVEEIVEDVFISLWTNRSTIRNEESLRPWLFASIRNKTMDYFRTKLNSPLYEDYVNVANQLIHSTDNCRIEYMEFERMVMNEIASLPRSQREVVTLSRIEGLSNAEIVERSQLSMQTVKNLLSQGLKQLRAQLIKHKKINFMFILSLFTSTC